MGTAADQQAAQPSERGAPPAATLPEALARPARWAAPVTFVDAELDERVVPHAELEDMAARAAGALRAHGLAPGDRVCLVAPTSPELVATLLGTWRAGLIATMAPLPRTADTGAWMESLAARMALAGAGTLLVPAAFTEVLAATGAERILGLEDLVTHAERFEGDPGRGADDVAYLQFTSGSTGASRAVALTHRQILWNVFPTFATLELGRDDVRVSWLPVYHDFGLVFLLTSLCTGAPLVLQPTEQYLRRPGSWLDACARHGAAVTAGPNSAFGLAARELALNPRELDLSSLRVALNGSEPVHAETVDAFVEAAGRHGMPATAICPAYGLAESTLAVSWGRLDAPATTVSVARDGLAERGGRVRVTDPSEPGARRLVGCGWPIDETRISIVGDGGEELGPWRVGEIVVDGPSVMVGYWGDEEATAEALRDGLLHTGDLGFKTDTGELVPCGRIKDMIIAGGRNLYPEEYEFVAERVDGIRKGNAVAFSLPELERMVVVAETKVPPEGADALARRLFAALRQELDPPPSEVVVVPPGTVPKTSSGKRQRRLCRTRYEAGELDVLGSARR